jgi:hypothetical protein
MAHAHRAQATGVDPAARLVEAVILGGPHLMLAHIGGDESVATGDFPEFFHHELRLDQLVGTGVLEAFAPAPGVDLLPPRGDGCGAAAAGGFELGDQFDQHFAHVAHDGHIHLHPFGDRRRIDVDVDDLAVGLRKMLGIADHAVIEARAHGQQHVAVLHGEVGFVGAVHAGHAHVLLPRRRIAAQAHQRVGAGRTQQIHQLGELGRGIGQNHAAAGVDHGALGRTQQLHGLFDLPLMTLHHRRVRAHRDRRGACLVLAAGNRDVFGDIHQHRARTAGTGDVERAMHDFREFLDVFDQEVVLDAGA